MTKVLVKFDDNWADEMDLHGFTIESVEDYNVIKGHLAEHSFPKTYYAGTNQDIEYRSAEDVLKNYTVTQITDEEAAVIKKLFGPSYGELGPMFSWDYEGADPDDWDAE